MELQEFVDREIDELSKDSKHAKIIESVDTIIADKQVHKIVYTIKGKTKGTPICTNI